ncbi:hypothetical protein NKR23_g861 [Pleurostoma richardsiae]|uniref:Uncharacterized protein n=1 Tax=Pleurostoma richardsiae TaxID=41990 RepID=A0AA38VJU2_9PEZI|nr:hypothetical protein NKR23_g861 [Pleurostoma richardsiae]
MPLPTFQGSSPYRPAAPSPLSSSSPIRASSPPLALRDPNTLPRRDIQSSPIQPAPKFKFASRPARPNPVLKKREEANGDRRRLFLQNVRRRAEDQRWERRGGENELLKLEWFSMDREFRQAKNSDIQGIVSDAEIEDAARIRAEKANAMPYEDPDEMMADVLAQEEQAELDALISSMDQPPSAESTQRPDSPHWSDDEDYDSLFRDFVSQEGCESIVSSGQMDMS